MTITLEQLRNYFRDESVKKIFTFEVNGYDDISYLVNEYLFTTSEGFRPKPFEHNGNRFYHGNLETPAIYSRSLFKTGTTGGESESDYGAVVVRHSGKFDSLQRINFDGRTAVLKIGVEVDGVGFDDYYEYLNVVVDFVEFTDTDIIFNILNKDAVFDTPLQPNKYAGDNALPTDTEGTVDTLKGKPKPLCYGECYNVSPVMVNSGGLLYQFHDGASEAVMAVYDKGVALTEGALNDYTADLATSIITLNAPPAGRITADVKGDNSLTGYVSTPSEIMERIARVHSGYGDDDFDAVAMLAVATNTPHDVGIYIAKESTPAKTFDALSNGLRLSWSHNREGTFGVNKITPPTGSETPVASFKERDIVEISQITPADENRGLPDYSHLLEYRKNHTVQSDSELAAGVSLDRAAELGNTGRSIQAVDDTVKVRHLHAGEAENTCLIVSDSQAKTQNDENFAIAKVAHRHFRVVVRFESLLLDINDIIEVEYPRHLLEDGVLMLIYNIEKDPDSGEFELLVIT